MCLSIRWSAQLRFWATMDVDKGGGNQRDNRRPHSVGQPWPKLQKPPKLAVGLRKSAKQNTKTRIQRFGGRAVSNGPAGI